MVKQSAHVILLCIVVDRLNIRFDDLSLWAIGNQKECGFLHLVACGFCRFRSGSNCTWSNIPCADCIGICSKHLELFWTIHNEVSERIDIGGDYCTYASHLGGLGIVGDIASSLFHRPFLGVDAQEILAESKSTAEKVKEDTIAKAKEEANKIRDDAKEQIQVEKDKALNEIKKEVADLSISIAEKLINKNLSDAENKAMIKESLKKVKQYEAWV